MQEAANLIDCKLAALRLARQHLALCAVLWQLVQLVHQAAASS